MLFGIVEYLEIDIISVPLTLGNNIESLDVSDFEILNVDVLRSYMEGEDNNYKLFITPEIEQIGILSINAIGRVYRDDSSGYLDMQTLSSDTLSVPFNTVEPKIISRLSPPVMLPGTHSVYLDLNRDVVGLTPQGILITGADVGSPKIFAAPTPISPNPIFPVGTRPFPEEYREYSNTDIPRRYYRIDFDFPNPPPLGNLNIDLVEGSVFGYIDRSLIITTTKQTGVSTRQRINKRTRQTGARQSTPITPLSLNMQDEILIKGRDFEVSGVISGNPTHVYVEGLLRGWRYIWNISSPTNLRVIGDGVDVDIIESGIWKVIMQKNVGTLTELIENVNWRIEEVAPVIVNPGTIKFYKDVPANLLVEIRGDPGGISSRGLLNSMKSGAVENTLGRGALISGYPNSKISLSENRRIDIHASTSGGTDTENFLFEVADETPPRIMGVSRSGDMYSWDSVLGALAYEYALTEVSSPANTKELEWEKLGNETIVIITEEQIPENAEFLIARVSSPWTLYQNNGGFVDLPEIIISANPPSIIRNLSISENNGSMTISWGRPSSNGGDSNISYYWRASYADHTYPWVANGSSTTVSLAGTIGRAATDSGINYSSNSESTGFYSYFFSGLTFTIEVYARNSGGNSHVVSTVHTITTVPTAPSHIRNIRYIDSVDDIDWDTSRYSGISTRYAYRLFQESLLVTDWRLVPGRRTLLGYSNLTVGATYTLDIRTVSSFSGLSNAQGPITTFIFTNT